MSLTDKQNNAKNGVIKWFKEFKCTSSKPVKTIAGIAGAGKTYTINYITRELNLDEDEIAYCAYTGMAATVLIRRGMQATTIHRLIYKIEESFDKKTKKKIIKFVKKDKLDDNLKLIVADEGSTISEELMNDLISFGIPILQTGDYFQLKPVGGNINRFMLQPDYFLDEPMRQSLENPIYWLANEIRLYREPKIGDIGDTVHIYSKDNFPEECLQHCDQILTGKNNTAEVLNKFYRTNFLNKNNIFPTNGEKLMCLRNNWVANITENNITTFLVNGLMGTASNISFKKDTKTFLMDFKPIFFEKTNFKSIIGDSLMFKDANCIKDEYIKENFPYENLMRKVIEEKDGCINKFKFGYAITTHKSQGSEFDSVCFFKEVLSRDTYYNLYYTAVTRAKEELFIIV